jgi:cellulose synthase/poly-beta-1,6-N-acetylglucosamine synthase-like glycosyltransferase
MIQWSAFAQDVAIIVSLLVITTGGLQSIVQLIQLGVSLSLLMQRPPAQRIGAVWHRYADVAPPIALLVPAYNEEKTIVDSLQSLLALQYPNIEVVVVNDGSTDNTLSVLVKAFGLVAAHRDYDQVLPHKPIRAIYRSPREPRLTVVDKVAGGSKADALNCAINMSRSPLICAIDADSLLEPDSLLRAVKPFIDDPERTIGVGATVRPANGCRVSHGRVLEVKLAKSYLAILQTIEYLRAFLMARLALGEAGLLTIVSGAFGLFRRQSVMEVGGYDPDTVGEDFELVMKLHRYMREHGRDYRIDFVPEPVCWTQVPETWTSLGHQRARWHRGAMETFFKHKKMLANPRYGRVGLIGYPSMLLVDVVSPISEVLGYILVPVLWALGLLSVQYFIAFLALSFSFGVAVSVGALMLHEIELRRFTSTRELVILFLAAIAENFGYRQINNFWRLRGLWQYLRGQRHWGEMQREEFGRT